MTQENPFPGMNPYLEQYWRDVHQSLVIYCRDQLQDFLPTDLRARVEERVYVESPDDVLHGMYPDVRITERVLQRRVVAPVMGNVAMAEPMVVEYEVEAVTEGYIEVREAGSGNRVITVIEILSRTNKTPGVGQTMYHQKQAFLRDGGVSLVEIDLLRDGKSILVLPRERIPPSYRTPYQVCVRRGWQLDKVEVYRVPLRERLPIIRIPLRKTDPDAPLDLQAVVEQAYRNGRYDDIDYRKPAIPPLTGGDAAWAAALLRKKGLRPLRKEKSPNKKGLHKR